MCIRDRRGLVVAATALGARVPVRAPVTFHVKAPPSEHQVRDGPELRQRDHLGATWLLEQNITCRP
eukprot:8158286-Alexandrium_andersonii.AAC.1